MSHPTAQTSSTGGVLGVGASATPNGLLQLVFSPLPPGRTDARASDRLGLAVALGIAAMLGLLFQIGHFFEHAAQFFIWLLGDFSKICGRNTPWMSPWVAAMVDGVGLRLFPAADPGRRMMLSMELLHLVGNTIFLTSIGCLYYCIRSSWVRWAFAIEGFHLCEHLALTSTAFLVGKPIGISTLFGYAPIVGTPEFAVGYRVTWHFVMNLLPMPFAMIALSEHLRLRLTGRRG